MVVKKEMLKIEVRKVKWKPNHVAHLIKELGHNLVSLQFKTGINKAPQSLVNGGGKGAKGQLCFMALVLIPTSIRAAQLTFTPSLANTSLT